MRSLTLTLLFAVCFLKLNGQTITTIAGNGSSGYSGDGGPATAAQLAGPFNIAVDSKGRVLISDRFNNRIRMIEANGIIATVAGTGAAGYSGDGGQATNAQLSSPTGIAWDNDGNTYIVDDGNNCVRKVNESGIITTVAGVAGSQGYSGDGGPATRALFNGPRGIAVDNAGILYITDTRNHCIRKVNTDGIITTVAGNGTSGFSGDGGAATSAQLYGPYYVAMNVIGDMYIADVDNERIRKVSNGIITTVAGNGAQNYNGDSTAATAASLNEPMGIATDRFGNIYIGDAWNSRIRYIDANTGIITTIAGHGIRGYAGDGRPAQEACFDNPYGIAVGNNGEIYIADYSNNRIRRIERSPSYVPKEMTVFPNPSSGKFAVIVNSDFEEQLKLTITDIQGRRAGELSVLSNTVIDVNIDLPPGLYFLSATGNGAYRSRLLIQR